MVATRPDRRPPHASSRATETGPARLHVAIDRWCNYRANGPFPNGCFVTGASRELDEQAGDLCAFLEDTVRRWWTFLRAQIVTAQSAGEVAAERDPGGLVSQLAGNAMAANQEIQVLDDNAAAEASP
ncbi:TetR family transcriptional regulator C-terminal domain-containing protein [Streptomyces sp. NPDC057654]|uniref:TetR family transcriptional regulator C-terminal domain-containing protein n=1 Tax=Streptomyces sp. NPDC057654 TaxID=3346196 RepID=UPI00367B5EED